MKTANFFILFCFFIFLSSCVSKKKYAELLIEREQQDTAIAKLQEDTAKLNFVILELTALNAELKKTVETKKANYSFNKTKIKKRTISNENEYKNKSTFIYQFTKYIQFNKKHENEYTIAVLGKSPVYNKLKSDTEGKIVGDKKIIVTHCNNINSIKDCNILFIASNYSSSIGSVCSKLSKNLPLIISEKDNMLNYGSHINFYIDGDDVKFKINEDNITRANILISSFLINLAK